MYADVLLLRLDHPDAFLPHCPDYSKDVDVLRHQDLLKYSVQCDERTAAANTSAAMNDDRPLVWSDFLSERSNESSQRLRRIWYTEVRPRCEMEMLNDSLHVSLSKKYVVDEVVSFFLSFFLRFR